eukprot:CAMPEP_0202695224 /NCGR_PEP_ID=MMETSP1385-20130828/8872_1 /ASSEMBLY_ACC=CAM_ASM_000861 /TAXON_ID=933848 /ORGANISM="Elphidium margaritaceum" /LENGTH=837 /DNA_ID=CAMNT_0049351211 /DNA_START=54 /DNA_END=2567 /DNA_ORIENTATION=+
MATFECHIKVGERVETHENLRGTCRYVGPCKELGAGIYVGIELDTATHDGHDGCIEDTQYFKCVHGHGQFVFIDQCTKIDKYINGYLHGHDDDDEAFDTHRAAEASTFEQAPNASYTADTAASPNNILSAELNVKQASNALTRKFQRRPSQSDLEKQGLFPPNYFESPLETTQHMHDGHALVSSYLNEWIPNRPLQNHLGFLPPNYFDDPNAVTKGKQAVKRMIANNLEEFHQKRPTLDELQMKNIIPQFFAESMHDPSMEYEMLLQQQVERQQAIQHSLNEKLSKGRRPTITDLGDMHIIPHDYLDNLLEDAVANHQRKESRMDHVQQKLQRHLPEPVAHTLAETLLTSVHDGDDDDGEKQLQSIEHGAGNDHDHHAHDHDHDQDNDNDQDNDDEWQISFVYEPMTSFVPMNPSQKDDISSKLNRRLSLRPSQHQIEVWGIVPPQYFESPQQSINRQHLGRDIAFDLLEGFLPHREDIYNLTNRGIMHPDFITQDHDEAVKQQHKRKKSVMEELNTKLDPTKRPSIVDLSDKGLIPDNWLLDLYGLADQVRKRHRKMDSAVIDLKSQLNVPPVLADVVARDVLDEIETVDPYLDRGGGGHEDDGFGHRKRRSHDADAFDDDEDDDEDGDGDDVRQQPKQAMYELRKEIAELKQLLSAKDKEIVVLRNKNASFEQQLSEMAEMERAQMTRMKSLESKHSVIDDQNEQIKRLREEQNAIVLHKLDAKATEMELSKERLATQKLNKEKDAWEQQMLQYKHKCEVYEHTLEELEQQKTQFVERLKDAVSPDLFQDAVRSKVQLINESQREIQKLRQIIRVLSQQAKNGTTDHGILSGFFG